MTVIQVPVVKVCLFVAFSDPSTPPVNSEASAKPVAPDYSSMSKSQMNAEYDKLRMAGDVFKAEDEGMKMHKAYFKK